MFILASLALLLAPVVHASVYVTNPVQSTQCTGGQACLVQWVDNGQAPLLPDIGECQVGLYTGEFQLVQSLPSVNVATTSSFSFTPDPSAGPSGPYYIVFSSTAINYRGFSGSFTITGLSGTTPGGSSTPASTPATTATGSSASSGSSTPATTPTDTASTPSGTSNPVTGTDTSTGSPSVGTAPSGSPTLTTPTEALTSGTPTPTTPTTISSSRTTTTTSASATPTNAAGRVGSSTPLVGLAAILAGVLAL